MQCKGAKGTAYSLCVAKRSQLQFLILIYIFIYSSIHFSRTNSEKLTFFVLSSK